MAASVERLGVAIQGAGYVSTEHLRAYLLNPHVEVVAVASRTREGAERKAREVGLDPSRVRIHDDYESLLNDRRVDALSLCTPAARHADETVRAARAGKHMLIEKPVAATLEELHAAAAAVRGAQVRTVVGFVLRWNPLVQTIRQMLADGLFGDLLYVHTSYWHNVVQSGIPWAKPGPRTNPLSIMVMGGCHAMDMARFLVGSDVTQVSALAHDANPLNVSPANTATLCRFATGVMGHISACSEQWMPYVFNIDLLGTGGAIRGNRFFSRRYPGATGFIEIPTVMPDNGQVGHHSFRQEIDHFVDCVRMGVESHVSLSDAVNTHEACLAADLSAEAGGTSVDLPLPAVHAAEPSLGQVGSTASSALSSAN